MERTIRVDMILSMLKNEPEDIFLNYSLGLEYFAIQDFEKAEESLKRTIELKADYIPAFFQLGKVYEAQQLMDEALHYYKQGQEFAKKQQNTKAVNEFSEAVFMLED